MDRLLTLQDLDLSIDRLTSRRRELETEEDIRMARSRLEEAERRLGEIRLAIDALGREQRRLEGDVDSFERKIQAESRRLFDGSVANARELRSIEAEVGGLRARKARTEDAVIDHMERLEQLGERLASAEAEVTEAGDRVAELEETTARGMVEIQHALGSRLAERKALAVEVDPELLDLYEDLRRQKRGIGVAALSDGVCQGCHQKLSAVYLERLRRSTGIKRCEYCRRILIPA